MFARRCAKRFIDVDPTSFAQSMTEFDAPGTLESAGYLKFAQMSS